MTIQSFGQFRQKNALSIADLIELSEGKVLSVPAKIYKKQEVIYQAGDRANRIFIIQQGRVKVGVTGADAKEMIKGIYDRGEFFGETSLVNETYRQDFAVAMEESKVYVLNTEKLNLLMRENAEIKTAIMRTLGERLIERELRLQAMIFKSSRSRIIEFLIHLSQHRGQRVGYEMVVRKFMTHKEIAGLTDTSRQTVTTVLNELRNKRILTFNRRRLLVRNMDLLMDESLKSS